MAKALKKVKEETNKKVGIEEMSKKDIATFIKLKSLECLMNATDDLQKGDFVTAKQLAEKTNGFLSSRSIGGYVANSGDPNINSTMREVTDKTFKRKRHKITKHFVCQEFPDEVIVKTKLVKGYEVV